MSNKLEAFKESFMQAMMEDYELLTELKKADVISYNSEAFKLYKVKGIKTFEEFVDTVIKTTLERCQNNPDSMVDESDNFIAFPVSNNANIEGDDKEVWVFGGQQVINQQAFRKFDNKDKNNNEDINYGVIHSWYEHYKNIDECLSVLKQYEVALQKGTKYFGLATKPNSMRFVYNNIAFVTSIKRSKHDFNFLHTFFPVDFQTEDYKNTWIHLAVETDARYDATFIKNTTNNNALKKYLDIVKYPVENLQSCKYLYNKFKRECMICKIIGEGQLDSNLRQAYRLGRDMYINNTDNDIYKQLSTKTTTELVNMFNKSPLIDVQKILGTIKLR